MNLAVALIAELIPGNLITMAVMLSDVRVAVVKGYVAAAASMTRCSHDGQDFGPGHWKRRRWA